MQKALFSAIALAALAGCSGQEPEPEVAPEQPVSDASTPVIEAEEPAPAPVSAATSEPLTAEGWGDLRIGMTREEIVAAYGPDANPNAAGAPEPDVCDEFRPENAPAGMRVMLTDGKLARISIARTSDVKTGERLGLGAYAEDVKEAYGHQAIVTPHKYVEAPAQYVTVWTTGQRGTDYVQDESARGLRYVIGQDGKVEQIHAGGPAIQLVEGCL